ncbi:unnamed protein product [Taenia asiatica]|uniref:Secreted protein n=1 Tax=Taenia asiatica TaxID=60517 RepID=A0A0R3VSY1_TAEAS|nr:unnamed protein product [Taenia asiatica]
MPLLCVALSLFENLETHRRHALDMRLRRFHLILLLCSLCATLKTAEAKEVALLSEVFSGNSGVVTEIVECAEAAAARVSIAVKAAAADCYTMWKNVLTELRQLRVAVDVFLP